MADRVAVPCNGCTACCRIAWCDVQLEPDNGDDPAAYRTVPRGGALVLARAADGACVYLGPAGCTLFGTDPGPPAQCRRFDCRALYAHTNDQGRAQLVRDGRVPAAIFDAAEKRLEP